MIIDDIIQERVEVALLHQFRLALTNPTTGLAMTPNERGDFLTRAFVEIANGMGVDRFMQTPVERLDQFAVMSVQKDHDTAGLLRSLVNSFMIAYACPETADRAFKALVEIEGLRAEVADTKGQGKTSNKRELVAAAEALDADLRGRVGPYHTATSPMYRVLVGADRLYVKTAYPLKGLPSQINGFTIETSSGLLN